MNDYEGEIVLAAIDELTARIAQMEVKQKALEVYGEFAYLNFPEETNWCLISITEKI